MELKVKRVREDAILPTRGSEEAAGYDLYANFFSIEYDYWMIQPGETIEVKTGIAVAIPKGYFGGIYARSGLSIKNGVAPANKVGVIDSDYRGEIIVALHNHSDVSQLIKKGDRIAQLIVQPYCSFEWQEVDELDDTERGEGGFGSTGK